MLSNFALLELFEIFAALPTVTEPARVWLEFPETVSRPDTDKSKFVRSFELTWTCVAFEPVPACKIKSVASAFEVRVCPDKMRFPTSISVATTVDKVREPIPARFLFEKLNEVDDVLNVPFVTVTSAKVDPLAPVTVPVVVKAVDPNEMLPELSVMEPVLALSVPELSDAPVSVPVVTTSLDPKLKDPPESDNEPGASVVVPMLADVPR